MPEPRHPPLEVHSSDRDGCPRRFYEEHISGVEDTNEPAKVGTAVHECARYIQEQRAESPGADLLLLGIDELRRQVHGLLISPAGAIDALDILEDVLDGNSRLSLWVQPGWSGHSEHKWTLKDTGYDFDVPYEEETEFAAAGTIDLIQTDGNVVRVDDYKTTIAMPSNEDAWNSWQLRLYAFAALRLYPNVDEVDAGFLLLRHGYRASATFLRGDPWEDQVARRIRAIRESRKALMDDGTFPENPGPWCDYCPVLTQCDTIARAAEQGRAAGLALDDAGAARLWKGVQAAASALQTRCKKSADARDYAPLPLDDAHGTVLGLKPKTGWILVHSYEKTMERLREFGMTPEMEVDKFRFCLRHHLPGRVKKVLGELGIGGDLMEEVVEPVAVTTFTCWVPDEEPEDRSEMTLEELEAEFDRRKRGA